eukprot:TRINITY_DN10294_c0_g1_i4.p1 TRINITY_DN10294_c0_g1~~TRINITY_DN10294_c0_g1_i4.p1  ORF type:complete len:441 (+),score=100.12 TRINITY_DN10294_c0_g1_i4:194-1516(+)
MDTSADQQNGEQQMQLDEGGSQKRKFGEQSQEMEQQQVNGSEMDGVLGDAGQYTDHIDVPEKLVGKLIGRNGETISFVEKSTRTKLQVEHNSKCDPKRVSISGTTSAQIEQAKALIREVIDSNVGPGQDLKRVIQCDQSMVGRVIGRAGDTIRALQQASSAKIVVNQEFPDGIPREVVISGKIDAVSRAEIMVNELIGGESQSVQQVIMKHGLGETQYIECPKGLVGRVIGKGGDTIKNLQRDTGASVQIDQSVNPCKITVNGMRGSVDKAVGQLYSIMQGNVGSQQGYGQQSNMGIQGGPTPTIPMGGYSGYGAFPSGAMPNGYVAFYPQSPYVSFAGNGVNSSQQAPFAVVSASPATQPVNQFPQLMGAQDMFGSQGGFGSSGGSGGGGGRGGGRVGGMDDEWREGFAGDGRPYYYNVLSGQSQWTKPASLQQQRGMF